MSKDAICSFERTGLIGTDSNDPLTNRFVVKERIEFDHSMNVGERHAQGSGNLLSDRFGDPAINTLSRVQGWQKPRAAQWDVRFNCREEWCKVNFGHGFSEIQYRPKYGRRQVMRKRLLPFANFHSSVEKSAKIGG
jgi:hypothetical protein